MAGKSIFMMFAAASLATSASAQDADHGEIQADAAMAPAAESASSPPETISVLIQANSKELWSGSLRLGGDYGSASFSFSKNQYPEPCPGKPAGGSEIWSSGFSVDLSISRENATEFPDRYVVSANWTQPLTACQGQGGNSVGFNRSVEIPAGRPLRIDGSGGLAVTLTRPR